MKNRIYFFLVFLISITVCASIRIDKTVSSDPQNIDTEKTDFENFLTKYFIDKKQPINYKDFLDYLVNKNDHFNISTEKIKDIPISYTDTYLFNDIKEGFNKVPITRNFTDNQTGNINFYTTGEFKLSFLIPIFFSRISDNYVVGFLTSKFFIDPYECIKLALYDKNGNLLSDRPLPLIGSKSIDGSYFSERSVIENNQIRREIYFKGYKNEEDFSELYEKKTLIIYSISESGWLKESKEIIFNNALKE